MEQIGIFAWFGFFLPLAERLRLIGEAGFSHASLWWGHEFEETDGTLDTHPALARDCGLAIDSVHLPYADSNLLWEDSLRGDAYHRLLTGLLAQCGTHRIPVAVLHPNDGPQPPPTHPIGRERIRRLAEMAGRNGTVLALENLHVTRTLDDLFEQINAPSLGFCYDSGHDHIFGEPAGLLLEQHGHRLACLHLHDNDGVLDRHGLPGTGAIDWPRRIGEIRASGYRGVWSLEAVRPYLPATGSMGEPASFAPDRPEDALHWLLGAKAALMGCLAEHPTGRIVTPEKRTMSD